MAKYDELARHYFERRKDFSRLDYNRDIEVPAMIKAIGGVKNKIILDLGCGFGDHMSKLSKKGAKQIIGLDLSKELVNLANAQKIPRCKFMVHDLNKKLPFKSNSFDIAFSSLTLHYIKNLDQLFSEVCRVLKRNGLFVFSRGHPVSDLTSSVPGGLIGVIKKGKKRIIYGNYFDESLSKKDLGSLGWVSMYNYTYETTIKTFLRNGFELIDYIDIKPVPSSRKRSPEKYRVCTTLPTFAIFKLRKK